MNDPAAPSLLIWQLPCRVIDAVLATNFESSRLVAMLPEMEEPMERSQAGCCFDIPPDHLAYGVAHRFCHEAEGAVSRRIQDYLDIAHEEEIRELRRTCPQRILEMSAACLEDAVRLPGFLWAVVTDGRPELCKYQSFLVQGLFLRMVRNWLETFGPPSWTAEL